MRRDTVATTLEKSLFGNNCNVTECDRERTNFDFFVLLTDENGTNTIIKSVKIKIIP